MDKNLVVRFGTTWLCNLKRVVVVWMVWATCVVQHFMLCDQDGEPPNVGALQKKFVRHNGLTKMLCAFCHFIRCSRAKFIRKIVDVWTLIAQQLFA